MIIVQTVCRFANNKSASLRQASAYGIGVIAQHGGTSFTSYSEICLNALDQAINFPMSEAVAKKNEKKTQFNHARDNAIASLGKILKYQKEFVQTNPAVYGQLSQRWFSLLPITHDTEEAMLQYEFLGDFVVQEAPVLFAGDAQAAVNHAVKVFAEAWQETYFNETNKTPISNAVKFLQSQANAQFMQACQQPDVTDEMRGRLDGAFKHN